MKIWVYIPSIVNRKNADKDYPICQTYVDTVLEGCIDFGEKIYGRMDLSKKNGLNFIYTIHQHLEDHGFHVQWNGKELIAF